MKIKEQNFTQAGTVLLISAVIVKLIGALFKIPLSSDYVLGDLGFGYFSVVYDLYIPINTLALSGFPVAIAKVISDMTAQNDDGSVRKVYGFALKFLSCIGNLGTFVFLLIGIFLKDFKGDCTYYSFIAIAPSVLFCCIASVYRGYFEGYKSMTLTAISNVIDAISKLVFGLGGAFITMRITSNPSLASAMALAGITFGTLVSCVYLNLSFKKNNCFPKLCNFENKKSIGSLEKSFIKVLIPVAIASMAVGIITFIDSLTLRTQLDAIITQNHENAKLLLSGTTYKNIAFDKISTVIYGIKGKAHTLFNLVPTLTSALGVGAVPLIARYFVNKDYKNLIKNTNLCLKISSVLCMPAAAGFIALGSNITEFLYGDKSIVLDGNLLRIYGIAAIFGGLAVPTTSLLQAVSHQKTALLNILWGIIIKIVCNLFLISIPSINVYGAVWGTVISFAVIFVLNICYIVKYFGFYPDVFNCFLKPMLSAIFCGITAFVTAKFIDSPIGTLAAILLGGVIYLLFLWILKLFSKEEIFELVKK